MKSMKWKIEDCFASLAMTRLGDFYEIIKICYPQPAGKNFRTETQTGERRRALVK